MDKVLFKKLDELPSFFKEALCNPNNVFVFSTDVVKKTDCDLNSNKKPEINGPQSIIKIDNKTKFTHKYQQ